MTDLMASFCVEARDIVRALTSELLALEKSPGNADALTRCLRHAHTLKGSARIVGQFALGDMAHTLEDALLPLRGTPEDAESEYFTDLLRIVERMRESIQQIESEMGSKSSAAQEGSALQSSVGTDASVLETVRVEIAEMDRLWEGLSEASIQLGPLQNVKDTLQHAVQTATSLQESLRTSHTGDPALLLNRFRTAVDSLTTMLQLAQQTMTPSLSRLEREIDDVREQANHLRLFSVGTIFAELELAVRDASAVLDKPVTFSASGGDAKLEGYVLLAVRDALLHVLRNAVDHGIESASERYMAQKSEMGTIRLDVVRHGRRVEFRCHDDGRGVDPDKVRRALVQSRRLTQIQADALPTAELFEFLFETGLSTADRVTEISGRGVGLDVVRAVARRLRGQATIHSEVGRGTELVIEVPMSMSAMTVLSLLVGERTVLIPFDAVRQTLRMSVNEIVHSAEGESILYEQRAISFVTLHAVLGLPLASQQVRKAWTVVIVQAGSKWLALGADALVDTLEVVVKPLPPGVENITSIAGAAFDSQGDPMLVVDPTRLDTAAADTGPILAQPERSRGSRLPILVIDDSLTTRMLEQSILEAAGYTVDLSASAEDALRRAQARTYGLFIVDVEMPGMNGFEFTRITRADPKLASIPVIMVTSLGSSESRQRGLEAGASEYIVKGDFDQKHFVRKVTELLGDA